MQVRQKNLKCLICNARITHSHMGIDACRACGVFYRRAIKLKYVMECICSEKITDGDNKVTCRKCRFECFKEIFDRANATEIACCNDQIRRSGRSARSSPQNDEVKEPSENAVHEPSPINENRPLNCASSSRCTPLLETMKRAYGTLCQVRNSGETSALHLTSEQMKNDKKSLRPARYSETIPCSQIFYVGLTEFAKSAFEDYNEMPVEDQHALVQTNFQLIQSLDGSYRAAHNFPDDDTVMTSYTTYINDETIDEFFKDSDAGANKEYAIRQFRENMKETLKRAKMEFRKVKPTLDEFMVLFGHSFWNDCSGSLSEEATCLVMKNREAMLKELKIAYSQRGFNECAPRIGELLCLLAHQERVVELNNEHTQMYRFMNLFNEIYEGEKIG